MPKDKLLSSAVSQENKKLNNNNSFLDKFKMIQPNKNKKKTDQEIKFYLLAFPKKIFLLPMRMVKLFSITLPMKVKFFIVLWAIIKELQAFF